MIVKVVGTEITATTDVDGDFNLIDVPYGIYTLSFDRAGQGTFKMIGLEHNNTCSSTFITDLEANLSVNDVTLSITTNPAGSNGNYTYFSPGLISQINTGEITLSNNDLTNAGFSKGETVFLKA